MQSMTPLTKVYQWYYYNTDAHHLRNNPARTRHVCESEDNRNGARARQIKLKKEQPDSLGLYKDKNDEDQSRTATMCSLQLSNKAFMNSHVHIIGISEEEHGNQVWQWESSCMTLRCDWSDYTYSLHSRRGLDFDLEQKPSYYLPQHFTHCFSHQVGR